MYAPLQEDAQAHTNPFPNLHSTPTELRFTPLKLPLLSHHGPVNKSSTLTGGFTTSLLQDEHWDDDEYEDLEYIVIPADHPPAAGGRKRATATPKSAAAAPRSRKRGRNNTKPLPKRIKNDDDDDIYRSEDPDDHGRRHKSARWTKQELDLMHELCKEGKTGREIWGELRSRLGCTKSRSSVDFCRYRIKVSQVKWSDEDVLLSTVFFFSLLFFSRMPRLIAGVVS